MLKVAPLTWALVLLIILGTITALPTKAQTPMTITIKTDGTINPPTGPQPNVLVTATVAAVVIALGTALAMKLKKKKNRR